MCYEKNMIAVYTHVFCLKKEANTRGLYGNLQGLDTIGILTQATMHAA
jgi:hypothetical protein